MALVQRIVLGEFFMIFSFLLLQNLKLKCLSLDVKNGNFNFTSKPSTSYGHIWTFGFTNFKGLPFITGGYVGGSSSGDGNNKKTEIFSFDEEQWSISYDYPFVSKM